MKQINLDNVFFHGIDRWKYGMSRENELAQLNLILSSGALLSRNEQMKLYGEAFESKLEKYKNYTNYNGLDFVSICKKYSSNNRFSEAYKLFVEHSISIIISPEVLSLQTNISHSRLEDGEIQIKDRIPKKYFIGIAIDKYTLEDLIEYLISKQLTQDEILQELENEDRNNLVNEIRNLLKNNGYNLPIYQLSSGNPILTLEEVLEKYNINQSQKI